MTKLPFILGDGSIFRLLFWGGSAPCSKIFVGRPIKWLLLEEGKKKLWVHPSLINRSMNKGKRLL
jgi:hypothetical protein